jgi:hypothetical protein
MPRGFDPRQLQPPPQDLCLKEKAIKESTCGVADLSLKPFDKTFGLGPVLGIHTPDLRLQLVLQAAAIFLHTLVDFVAEPGPGFRTFDKRLIDWLCVLEKGWRL